MRKLLPVLFAALALAACSKPRLDTTSPETMAESTKKISESLSPEKRQRFAEAMTRIAATAALEKMQKDVGGMFKGMADAMAGKSPMPPPTTMNPNDAPSALLSKANGMTADEIIALGDQIRDSAKAP